MSIVVEDLPIAIIEKALENLSLDERRWVEDLLEYPDDVVGHLMSRDIYSMDEKLSINMVIDHLRIGQKIPQQHDKIFVVNRWKQFIGSLQFTDLLILPTDITLGEACDRNVITFNTMEDAEDAGLAFERNDLISAPIIDLAGRVLGRLTVEALMDYLRQRSDDQSPAREGLHADVDLSLPIRQSIKLRGFWLGMNLITAIIASRFIGLFENTIEHLVALATLMPIVASIGGNTGNQTHCT